MNKNELKKVLKPLIKECIKEVLLEEKGTLSHIISEVTMGLSSTTREVVKETRQITRPPKTTKSIEHKRKSLLDAIGKSAYGGIDVFEGTTPAPAPITEGASQGPLSGMSPNDPGVDISGIFDTKAFLMTQKMMEKK